VAATAVALGFGVSVLAGYLLGHYTGKKTVTVTVGVARGDGATAERSQAQQEQVSLPTDPGQAAAGDWMTNGGGYANMRYSSLDAINKDNVAQLKGQFLTHLNESGTANKYSQEGQPVEENGVLYVTTGEDDVFAVDAATGNIKWTYEANLPDTLADTICCGWDNRGVAVGPDMVYTGHLDGRLVALDKQTGNKVWEAQVARANHGFSITAAPLYYDGMVYTGPSGAEYGIRGYLDAYDAKTGDRKWRFHTIPTPGGQNGDSWPQNNKMWKRGGATIWNTPALDPKLGMLYFSTANAGSDWDGSDRKGDNLYSASIVAIDAKTGNYKWHFQQVHHDIWDYDSSSPTVFIDARINGQMRHGIAEPNKNGYVFFVDRATGKPIFPITEKPVPQSDDQKPSPTQPIPEMPPFAPQTVSQQQLKAVRASIKPQIPKGQKMPQVKAGKLYDVGISRGNTVKAVAPAASGGTVWQPSSYNPKTQMYYVCSQSGSQAALLNKADQKYKRGTTYTGPLRAFGFTGFNSAPGFVTAYDMTTGKIAWQNRWNDQACYSGTSTTAGGLTFVGRNTGELEALDAETGKTLWSFQTGAGANSTPSFYEHNGKEYVAFLAGGNALNGSAKGDNLWVFSLDGTMGPAAAPGSAKAIQHAGESQDTENKGEDNAPTTGDENAQSAPDAANGKTVFSDNCGTCHGADGHGGNGGPDLSAIPDAQDAEKVKAQVINGGGGMPAFGGQLTNQEIADVAEYVSKQVAK